MGESYKPEKAQCHEMRADRCTVVCSIIPHNRFASNLACVSLHSDGRREDGTEGEAPGLRNLLLEVCALCTYFQRIYGMSTSIPSHFRVHITEFRVLLHSDGGRQDGTEGEAPGLPNLLLEVCV